MPWVRKRKSAGRSGRSLLKSLRQAVWRGTGGAKRRQGHRVDLKTTVFLYGSVNGEPFYEYSETIDESSDGALVSVNSRLAPGQQVLITNLHTQQDLTCRIVRIDIHRIAAALAFIEPCPRFWSIDFASPSSPS
jgi:PilZ domain